MITWKTRQNFIFGPKRLVIEMVPSFVVQSNKLKKN
jgi:hypothetical protein